MILVGLSESAPSEYVAKATYGVYVNLKKLPEGEVEYLHRENGAPLLQGAPECVHISLSHSAQFVACALSEAPVGVDIQLKKDIDYTKISARYGMEATSKEDFYNKFTLAEARAKQTSLGLAVALREGNAVGKSYDFIPDYALSVVGVGEVIFVLV